MSVITTQNWDSTITGWTVDPSWATTVSRFTSSPNSIYVPGGFSGYKFLTWNTTDGNGGDVAASADFFLDDADQENYFGLCIRGSASPLDATSTSQYLVEVRNEDYTGSSWGIILEKQVAGTRTTLGGTLSYIGTSSIYGAWYRLSLTAVGTALSVRLQRASDNYYLDSSGTFTATVGDCLTATDSSIAGSGYAGAYAWGASGGHGSAVYTDDFELDTASTTTTVIAFDSASLSEMCVTTTALVSLDTVSTASVAVVTNIIVGLDSASTEETAAYFTLTTVVSLDTSTARELNAYIASILAFDSPTILEAAYLTTVLVSLDTASTSSYSTTIHVVTSFDAVTVGEWESTTVLVGLFYSVFANDGAGGPINYFGPVVTLLSATTWTSDPLTYAGDWKFAVRAYDLGTGLEEKNLDAAVEIVLDASGNDISAQPRPPIGLRAVGLKAGAIRLEWSYPYGRDVATTGFHIYQGTTGTPDYGTVVKTVAYVFGYPQYRVDLSPLTDGTTYTFGVRAYNATAEETNTVTVDITADATGPGPVASLTLTTTV